MVYWMSLNTHFDHENRLAAQNDPPSSLVDPQVYSSGEFLAKISEKWLERAKWFLSHLYSPVIKLMRFNKIVIKGFLMDFSSLITLL